MNGAALWSLFTEFGPIIVLFVAGQLTDFNTAVAYFVGATAGASAISWWRARQLPVLPLISAVFVIVGGIITLVYDAPDAIIFADTIYYLLLALLFVYSLYGRHGIFLKRLFGNVFAITDRGWRVLTIRWLVLCVVAAIINEYVRQTASPEVWIDYRFYKTIAITLFAVFQLSLSRKYRIVEEANAWGFRAANTRGKA